MKQVWHESAPSKSSGSTESAICTNVERSLSPLVDINFMQDFSLAVECLDLYAGAQNLRCIAVVSNHMYT